MEGYTFQQYSTVSSNSTLCVCVCVAGQEYSVYINVTRDRHSCNKLAEKLLKIVPLKHFPL